MRKTILIILSALIWLGGNKIPRLLLIEPTMHRDDNKEVVRMAFNLQEICDDSAVVLIVAAGHLAYFLNRPCGDLLGKEDPYIAKLSCFRKPGLPWYKRLVEYYPGHLKWDYEHSVLKLKPDVVGQVWGDFYNSADKIMPYYTLVPFSGGCGISAYGRNGETENVILVRNDSRHIKWDKVSKILADYKEN